MVRLSGRGVAKGGGVVRPPRIAESKGQQNGRQNKYLKCKQKKFPQKIKISEEINGNSTISDFVKFIAAVRGAHCDYSPWARKNLATPLLIGSINK